MNRKLTWAVNSALPQIIMDWRQDVIIVSAPWSLWTPARQFHPYPRFITTAPWFLPVFPLLKSSRLLWIASTTSPHTWDYYTHIIYHTRNNLTVLEVLPLLSVRDSLEVGVHAGQIELAPRDKAVKPCFRFVYRKLKRTRFWYNFFSEAMSNTSRRMPLT